MSPAKSSRREGLRGTIQYPPVCLTPPELIVLLSMDEHFMHELMHGDFEHTLRS